MSDHLIKQKRINDKPSQLLITNPSELLNPTLNSLEDQFKQDRPIEGDHTKFRTFNHFNEKRIFKSIPQDELKNKESVIAEINRGKIHANNETDS